MLKKNWFTDTAAYLIFDDTVLIKSMGIILSLHDDTVYYVTVFISVWSRPKRTEKNFEKNQQWSEKPVRKANKYSDIKMDILMVSSRTFVDN